MSNKLPFNRTVKNKFEYLHLLVGNTPMVGIKYKYQGKEGIIHVKCEQYNLTGSIKDRMALYILEQAYKKGEIKPENVIVEATSGNTGIAFAAIGRALGHKVQIIMPDWLSIERKQIIEYLGADIISISKEQGGFLGSIKLSEEMAAMDSNIFLPCQFSNCCNCDAHKHSTGVEISVQLQKEGLRPDAFVAGVGTGGTVMGVGSFLKYMYDGVKIHPMEPAESPTMSTGCKVGNHRIQGISDEFIPKIVDLDQLDDVIQASDGDSIIMAQKLAAKLGLAVGISSGANMIAAIKLQQQYGADSVVVTVFSDNNAKYLSTDLMKPQPVKEEYISPDVELLDYISLPRAY